MKPHLKIIVRHKVDVVHVIRSSEDTVGNEYILPAVIVHIHEQG